jgi:AraC family ethanolamine operon transcriptional activator
MNNLSVQWGKDGGANIMEGTSEPGGITCFVPCKNESKISGNGRRMDAQSLMILVPGDEFCISASDWNRWLSVWISYETLGGIYGSTEALARLSSGVVHLASGTILRSFVEKLGHALHQESSAFDSVAAIAATERKLSKGVRQALDFPSARPAGRHTLPRRQIIRQVRDFIDQHGDEYLSVADLASAAGSSERTVRTAFQEYFSVGPVRYLNIRTLHLAREALRANDSSATTVAEVLTRFGVWEFGRFARDYRALFGELPSQTLRKNF